MYAAFLSYSHADARWANWLLRKLETYRVPSRLVGTKGAHGLIGPRLGKMFRDRDELPTAGHLGETIRAALADSDALIVICSPAAAQSRWVNAEIEAFRALGREERIACFIVDGEPGDNASPHCCFPTSIIAPDQDGTPREPLAADARTQGDGRQRAFLKLVAGLLGLSYDDLAQREAHRRHRRMLAITTASVLGMAVAIGLAVTAYVARNDAFVARNDAQRRQAQAEDIMGFMLGDLRDKLTKVGRLDLMSTVDDKATDYFSTLEPRDLSDATLEQQAQSLTNIGQVRLAEGKHDAAMAAFREALDRSSALYDRAPDNGQRLYDRAQAEYWIGFVGLQQGNYKTAERWLTQYHDSAVRLAGMDRSNFDWRKEVAYGLNNLAVMDQKRGRYAAAERTMRKNLALFRDFVRQKPHDLQLRWELADGISWLGTMAMSQGQLADAQAYFVERVEVLQRNVADEPDNANWKEFSVAALWWLSIVQAQRGQLAAASDSLDKATTFATTLAAQDPANNGWRTSLANCRVRRAELNSLDHPARAAGEAASAESLLVAARVAEPKSQRVLLSLVGVQNLQAQLALGRDDGKTALAHIAASLALIEPEWQRGQHEELRQRLAETRLVQGEVAQRAGRSADAHAAWEQVRQVLLEDVTTQVPFARLDPLVRALHYLGKRDQARPYLQRLDAAGYVPLQPWPTGAHATARRSTP